MDAPFIHSNYCSVFQFRIIQSSEIREHECLARAGCFEYYFIHRHPLAPATITQIGFEHGMAIVFLLLNLYSLVNPSIYR